LELWIALVGVVAKALPAALVIAYQQENQLQRYYYWASRMRSSCISLLVPVVLGLAGKNVVPAALAIVPVEAALELHFLLDDMTVLGLQRMQNVYNYKKVTSRGRGMNTVKLLINGRNSRVLHRVLIWP